MLKDLGPSSEGETRITVIFVFYNPSDNSVLLERRKKPGSFFDRKLIYPGGSVEKFEIENFEGALKREIKEELGVAPLVFSSIPGAEGIYGETGKLIVPFLITKWSGEIPTKVKDTESDLLWIDLNSFEPELESIIKITEAVKNCVAQSY